MRAADVTLKERRPLVLMVRETPLHTGHLRLMAQASEYGAIILPPVPAFYHAPEAIMDLVDHTVGKALDQFGIEANLFRRWPGPADRNRQQSLAQRSGHPLACTLPRPRNPTGDLLPDRQGGGGRRRRRVKYVQ